MCFTFLDIDFRDNEYSDHDVKETIANLRELQNRLNLSSKNFLKIIRNFFFRYSVTMCYLMLFCTNYCSIK